MELSNENIICAEFVNDNYQKLTNNLLEDESMICHYFGTFTQTILNEIVRSAELFLMEKNESYVIQKKLIYLIIECVQNIMSHAYKTPCEQQSAFIIVISSPERYRLISSNSFETEHTSELETNIKDILTRKIDSLSCFFSQRVKDSKIEVNGRGGIGLYTMINKVDNNFIYKISKISSTYSIFYVEFWLNLNN